jgi:hypothetical protein
MQASQATASEDNNSITKPKSLGEELYLVHLQRVAGVTPEEEDFDTLTPRKRAHSLGEELWDVHLKRSHGLEGDRDEEIPTDSAHNKSSERAEKNNRGKKAKKETSTDTSIQQSRYQLRKRGGGKAKNQ